jgi:spore germination protein GerM
VPAKPRGRLSRVAAAVMAVGAGSAGLAGCGLGAQSAPQPLGAVNTPPAAVQHLARPERPATDAVNVPVTLFLVGRSSRLVPVRSEVRWPATIAAALVQLAAGPTDSESMRGFVSPASSVGPLSVGREHDSVVAVNLPLSFENLGGEDQTVAAAQIVFTVTTFPGVKGVRFLIGGQAAEVPNSNGTLTPGPSTRADYLALAG